MNSSLGSVREKKNKGPKDVPKDREKGGEKKERKKSVSNGEKQAVLIGSYLESWSGKKENIVLVSEPFGRS